MVSTTFSPNIVHVNNEWDRISHMRKLEADDVESDNEDDTNIKTTGARLKSHNGKKVTAKEFKEAYKVANHKLKSNRMVQAQLDTGVTFTHNCPSLAPVPVITNAIIKASDSLQRQMISQSCVPKPIWMAFGLARPEVAMSAIQYMPSSQSIEVARYRNQQTGEISASKRSLEDVLLKKSLDTVGQVIAEECLDVVRLYDLLSNKFGFTQEDILSVRPQIIDELTTLEMNEGILSDNKISELIEQVYGKLTEEDGTLAKRLDEVDVEQIRLNEYVAVNLFDAISAWKNDDADPYVAAKNLIRFIRFRPTYLDDFKTVRELEQTKVVQELMDKLKLTQV